MNKPKRADEARRGELNSLRLTRQFPCEVFTMSYVVDLLKKIVTLREEGHLFREIDALLGLEHPYNAVRYSCAQKLWHTPWCKALSGR